MYSFGWDSDTDEEGSSKIEPSMDSSLAMLRFQLGESDCSHLLYMFWYVPIPFMVTFIVTFSKQFGYSRYICLKLAWSTMVMIRNSECSSGKWGYRGHADSKYIPLTNDLLSGMIIWISNKILLNMPFLTALTDLCCWPMAWPWHTNIFQSGLVIHLQNWKHGKGNPTCFHFGTTCIPGSAMTVQESVQRDTPFLP